MECNHDGAVARAGADGEPAHVIIIKFTDSLDDYVEFVRCLGGDIAVEWGHQLCWLGYCGLPLGGAHPLTGLCHMALEGFRVFRMVSFGVLVCEAWPNCVVASSDGP